MIAASPASALSEPSCDIIFTAQRLAHEAERSWALSQACAYYQHRCPAGDLEKESCIRIMGESCSARVLQCSLLNTMQNLEPDTEPHAQGERMDTDAQNLSFSPCLLHYISVSLCQQDCVVRGRPRCQTSPGLVPGLWAVPLLLQAAGPGWSTCSWTVA